MSDHPALGIRRVDLGSALVDYESGWDLQREVHADVVSGQCPPTILILEHAAIYTAGRLTQPDDRPTDGSRVIDVDRGGRITWHGPGQLVCYPIVTLPHPMDVLAHVRRLESAIMKTCADFGVVTEQISGRSGVWCAADAARRRPDRKIAAIGIRVSRGVTMHGLALNVDCDLDWSDPIVPCGIPDAGVTSMVEEGALVDIPHQSRLVAVSDVLEQHLRAALEPTLPKSHESVG